MNSAIANSPRFNKNSFPVKAAFLTASLSRRAGGVYDATRLLARSLIDLRDCEAAAFGLADDDTDRDVAGWRGVYTVATDVRGPSAFGYAPALADAVDAWAPDVLHAHGLWMYPSHVSWAWSRRWNRPYVVSPHGMLDPWAVNNSRWKKRLAGLLYEDAHLHGASCIHALCNAEYEAIRAYGLKNPVCVIPNGIDLPHLQTDAKPGWYSKVPKNARVLLYLGRIHPKKGLVNLLHAWQIAKQAPGVEVPWCLVIAGWDQGGHEAELRSLAEQLGIDDSVAFVGPQFDEAKHASYALADAFILPSFSEGLPMVALEAWAHKLPVLMTPQCNLPEGFEAEAALRIDPEPDSISRGLLRLFSLSNEYRDRLGVHGQKLILEKFTWKVIAKQMLGVYRWLLDQGPKPECVITD
jgi:glycosyltransferase involved in cell wall biosynthesis